MDIGDSPEEAAFRAEARAWLEQNATRRDPAKRHRQSTNDQEQSIHSEACQRWQRALYDGGWAGLTWPKRFGGRGGSPWQAAIFAEEQAKFDVSTGAFAVAHGMVAPTLMMHGTDEQRGMLDAMLRGDEIWAQLFSEPEAGSDLANLGTRAELDGNEWVVNGQKVWTSGAQYSSYTILLARTDPDAPKHQGITYFIVDMRSPGIEVRPLRQITGVAHFNEVFLTDVRIPVENVIGEVNGGWKIAHTTLSNERAMIGGGMAAWSIQELIDLARSFGRTDDPVIRQGLAEAYSRAEVLKFTGYRMRTAISRGETPGVVASTMKLFYARHWAATTGLAVQIQGADGMLWGQSAVDDGLWQQTFCGQYAVRIGGGTDEIQGNVIGERALGLPANHRPIAIYRGVKREELRDDRALYEELQVFVGQELGHDQVAADEVNVPMVRHWCEAMGDTNPVYLDEEAAKASVHGGLVAPPTMLQAWIMRPFGVDRLTAGPYADLTAAVEAAGFTSVVASNSEQTYDRYLRPGDRLTMRTVIDSISDEKQTALGAGHFITTRQDYFDAEGERVGSMLFRILKFRPQAKKPDTSVQPKALRPRPSLTHDQDFWFEGLMQGKLLIQKCSNCGTLRHPSAPMCRECRSLEWTTIEAAGGGSIHSFVVVHYPQIPSLDYPNQVVLVDLDEGVRVVANTVDTTREQLQIGARVSLVVQQCDDELALPFFTVVES